MKIYPNTEFPKPSSGMPETSVDVIICDKDNMLNIAFYSFDKQRWDFHTETFVDYYEGGKLRNFVWMYKPEELTCK